MCISVLIKAAALECTTDNFTKTGIHVRPSGRSNSNSDLSTDKPPWWKLLFIKVVDLESITTILLKADSTMETFRHEFFKIALFKTLENFLHTVFTSCFLIRLQASISTVVRNFTEISVFRIYRAKII